MVLSGVLGLAVLPSFGRAYTADALAQFQAGRQYQAARQWAPAVQAYEAALRADPSLTQAYKALGTIYYQAGDHKGALVFYDRYLTTNPGDTATKNFADGIRASLGAPAPAPAAAPVPPKKKRHWYFLWIV
jgi:tetratricopeptide (TPR) repeat protein